MQHEYKDHDGHVDDPEVSDLIDPDDVVHLRHDEHDENESPWEHMKEHIQYNEELELQWLQKLIDETIIQTSEMREVEGEDYNIDIDAIFEEVAADEGMTLQPVDIKELEPDIDSLPEVIPGLEKDIDHPVHLE